MSFEFGNSATTRLSLVYPEADASLPGELTQLRELPPAETALLVRGRAVPA